MSNRSFTVLIVVIIAIMLLCIAVEAAAYFARDGLPAGVVVDKDALPAYVARLSSSAEMNYWLCIASPDGKQYKAVAVPKDVWVSYEIGDLIGHFGGDEQ